MTTKIFTTEEIKDLKVPALARKYKCSDDYVRRVLKGNRERNTELAKGIMKDATDMLANNINRMQILFFIMMKIKMLS